MSGYVKLFGHMLDSTVWDESDATRLVWVTMLLMADRRGVVHASLPGLARRARVSLDDAKSALERLCGPDPYSRTPDHDGRRAQPVDGGWRILNSEKYRQLLGAEEKRERWARQKSAQRDKGGQSANVHPCPPMSAMSTDVHQSPPIAESREHKAEADISNHTVGHKPRARAVTPTGFSQTLTHRIRVEFERRYLAARGGPPSWGEKAVRRLAEVSNWVETHPEGEIVVSGLLDGFFADPWAEGAGHSIAALASDPMRFLKPPKPAKQRETLRERLAGLKARGQELIDAGRWDEVKTLTRQIDDLEHQIRLRGGEHVG